jgi:hypothetical protein
MGYLRIQSIVRYGLHLYQSVHERYDQHINYLNAKIIKFLIVKLLERYLLKQTMQLVNWRTCVVMILFASRKRRRAVLRVDPK